MPPVELDRCNPAKQPAPKQEDAGELEQLLRYISAHPSADLSVEALSKQMCLSVSGFTHLFKKELGITVHQYVKQRRLIYAQTLLQAGNKPTKVFAACGYGDYSSFYKAYMDFFGYPPSAENVSS